MKVSRYRGNLVGSQVSIINRDKFRKRRLLRSENAAMEEFNKLFTAQFASLCKQEQTRVFWKCLLGYELVAMALCWFASSSPLMPISASAFLFLFMAIVAIYFSFSHSWRSYQFKKLELMRNYAYRKTLRLKRKR